MNEQSIKEQYNSIADLLKAFRLKEAQVQLEAMLVVCGDWNLQSRLEQAQTSYHYMLQYMEQGVDDPGRDKLYRQLLTDTWEIANQTRANLLDSVSHRYYQSLHAENRRLGRNLQAENLRELETFQDDVAICQLLPDNQQPLNELIKKHEEVNRHVFQTVWGSSEWIMEEAQVAQDLLASTQLRAVDLCLFISAVTLSLMECFDIRKCLWLLDAYQSPLSQVNQRALVGLVIALYIHHEQASLYPELRARLDLLQGDGTFGRDLNQVYIQLLQSKDTDKVDKKMREEIFPEMLKNARHLMRDRQFLFEELSEEDDRNPDWEKSFENSKFTEKVRQMNEMQLAGDDLYFSTFGSLKSNAFFNQPSNWFYPFDLLHPAVASALGTGAEGENSMVVTLMQTGFFCDSDKYSLCFTLNMLPQNHRENMLNQIDPQVAEEIKDANNSQSFKEYAERRDVNSRSYIQSLYRFFKCYRLRNEFRDIFREKLVLHDLPLLEPFLDVPERLVEVANFHFHKEHYAEALELYQRLANGNQADADIFQKIGYCLQKGKRYEEAVKAYRNADLLKPDHLWTLRHLATCYRLMHDFAKALAYYRKVEEIQPESHQLLFFIGSCYTELGKYSEALQYFFKLDFLDPHSIKAWRGIAWCSFLNGKYEQAEKYARKVTDDGQADGSDWMNAGHVAWVQGRLSEAARCYAKAIPLCGGKKPFIELFNKDRDTLVRHGIRESDMPLMLDIAG